MEPLITIVTAAWRKEGVENIIKCVDNQEYKNIQHILVRDNSPHISSDEIKAMCDGKKRHWIDLGMRTGWSGGYARNIGIMASFTYFKQSHKQNWDNYYIALWDDDNEFDHNHLSLMVDEIKKNTELSIVGTSMRFSTNNNIRQKKLALSPDNLDLGSFIYKRDLFFKYGFIHPRPECRFRFDYDFIKKMADGEKDNVKILDNYTWTFNARR